MERTNKKEEKLIEWIKDGGGSFRLGNGKIIKPNQKFFAYPSQIPANFRDVVTPLEEVPDLEKEEVTVEEPEYSLSSRGGGWFDIVDSNEKVMNEKALKREDALKFIEDLVG